MDRSLIYGVQLYLAHEWAGRLGRKVRVYLEELAAVHSSEMWNNRGRTNLRNVPYDDMEQSHLVSLSLKVGRGSLRYRSLHT
jgi:hypothetical protein